MNILSIFFVILLLITPVEMRAASYESGVENGLIALTLKDATGYLQISTIEADGTNSKQLTFERDNGRPAWSRDGKEIAYSSTLNRGQQQFVKVMTADGSNKRTLSEGEAPDWSPNGRKIAFSWNWQIWTIDADGTNQRQITFSPTAKRGPSWSPDGRQIVFILLHNPGAPNDPQPRLGIMNADGTNERLFQTNIPINPDANAPSWSPVSDEIAFWSGIENRNGQIWIIHSDGTGARQLIDDSDDPSWSPDGQKIIFSTGRSRIRNELWVMDKDGQNQRRIHAIDAFPFPGRGSWQPIIISKSVMPN